MRNRWTRSTYRKRGKIKISPRGAGPRDETLFFILSLTSYPPFPRALVSVSLSHSHSLALLLFDRAVPPSTPRNSPTIPSFSRTRHVASQIGLYVQVSPINSTFSLSSDTRRILTHRRIVAMLINDVKINQPRATTFGNARGLLTVVRKHRGR